MSAHEQLAATLRVGFTIQSLHGGGAEFVVRRWASRLSAEGHQVFAYTYMPERDGDRDVDAQVRRFPGRTRPARFAQYPLWLMRQAQADRLDVLISLLTFANIAALTGARLTGSRIPLVVSERNVPSILLPVQGRAGRMKRRLARRLYPGADAVVAISHPVAGDLIGGYGVRPRDLFIVPNPVLPVVARPAARSRYRQGEQELRVVFAGRLVPQKRPELFLEVLAELQRRGHRVRGLIVGDGKLRERVTRRAGELGVAVELLGWREPWWAGLDGAHCLLLTSSVEGFGNVLIEAAAAGMPSVASSSSLGAADAVVPGITGELVAGSRPEDFADGVLRAVAAPDAPEAVERWLERFSEQRSVEELLRAVAHAREAHGGTRG